MKTRNGLACIAAGILAACGGDSIEPLVPTTLELNHDAVTLNVDETVTLVAIVLDQHGNQITMLPDGFTVTWSVSNLAVAQVDGGLVTALGEGSVSVTASASGIPPVAVSITVEDPRLLGQLGFDYSGDLTGSFDVDSRFLVRPDQGPEGADWVVTFHWADSASFDVFAQTQRADGLFDVIWFWTLDDTPVEGTRDAIGAFIYIGLSLVSQTPQGYYQLKNGSVTFDSATSERRIGSFELVLEDENENELVVADGTFSAPVVPLSAIVADNAAMPAAAFQIGSDQDPGRASLVEALRFRERLRSRPQ